MPGPRTTTRFSSAENREFAAARSFSPTTSGVSAPAAGCQGASATADAAARTRIRPGAALVATTTAIAAMTAALASAETIRMVTR